MHDQLKKSYDGKAGVLDVFREYVNATEGYRPIITLMFIALAIGVFLDVLVPLYYKDFFDLLSRKLGGENVTVDALKAIIWAVLLLHIVRWVFMRFAYASNAYSEAKMMGKLRERALGYMIYHSRNFFNSNFTGSLVQRVNRYARAYERLQDSVIFELFPLSLYVVGITLVLAKLYPSLALLMVGWTAFFIGTSYFFSRWKQKYDYIRSQQDSRTTGVMADIITNHQAVQQFHAHERERKRFQEVSNDQVRATLFTWNLGTAFDGVQALLILVIEYVIFSITIDYWVAGKVGEGLGIFTILQAYVIQLSNKLWSFGKTIRGIFEALADAREMMDIMLHPHEIVDVPSAITIARRAPEITFEHVSFAYGANRGPQIKDLSFRIAKGERVGLVGPSGAGKTTLVNLLLRQQEATSGRILLGSTDIRQIALSSLRESFAFVPQNPELFHRTIMENIRFGRPDATDEEVIEAAKLAHCHEFVEQLPYKYDTYVGERGVKLSGGERQRVIIARTILKNAPILVLDEATSSLDSESEFLIQRGLENLMVGKTVIAIAHRLSTIRSLDRIIVLGEGEIREEGNHDDLLGRENGLYRKLWNLQSGGFLTNDRIAA